MVVADQAARDVGVQGSARRPRGYRSPSRQAAIRLAVAVLVLAVAQVAAAETLIGRVVSIADGDTITVLVAEREQVKVRLAGIDAPEKVQPFGQRSKENLSRLVFGKPVRVEWRKRDRYGRVVGKVWVQPASCPTCAMTLDAGHAQITVGLAWWYRKYASEQSPEDQGAYEYSEHEAKAKRVGLWSEPDPIPPWEWRQHRPTRR
ncbi:MAG TPA: thermonuclease family protein [Desulfobacterales bacterium]|nr:thermonuclease family protein [Desulfobacterales bacterium]